MTAHPLGRARVLVIGATSTSDFIRVGQIVELFSAALRNGDKQNGRAKGTIYTIVDGKEPVYVWATDKQITVHFGINVWNGEAAS